jgi:predicted nucleotidyltransferase
VTLDHVRRTLEHHAHLFTRAYVFGSTVRGDEDPYSDVDLILVRETRLEFFDRIREVFDLVFAFPRADILIYTEEELERMLEGPGHFFIKQAVQEAVRIEGKQGRGSTLAQTG